MVLALNSDNYWDYLQQTGLVTGDGSTVTARPISARNFNLIVRNPGQQTLLLKQETIDGRGQQAGKLFTEWQLQELIGCLPDLQPLKSFLPEVLHCDRENSIVVNHFFEDYADLSDYYDEELEFPTEIPASFGQLLGQIHGLSFERSEYQAEILQSLGSAKLRAKQFMAQMERIHPGLFAGTPLECLQFYKLYQQFPSLAAAVKELSDKTLACTLVHNDLKLNNILLHQDWRETTAAMLRPIDWERAGWGDPAGDLGMLISSYLAMWLDSVVVGAGLSITESLQLATVPLEALQPSLYALAENYLQIFPQILVAQPDYLERVLQHCGLALIGRIEAAIAYDRVFGNRGIITLQVAKQLLCNPAGFMPTIFGPTSSQLLELCA
jgi:Phosphotransferase enzyme family